MSVNEVSTTATLSPIEGEDAEIIIPIREVLEGLDSGAEVRMAALLFRNMSGLLPEKIDYEKRYKHVGDCLITPTHAACTCIHS